MSKSNKTLSFVSILRKVCDMMTILLNVFVFVGANAKNITVENSCLLSYQMSNLSLVRPFYIKRKLFVPTRLSVFNDGNYNHDPV